MERLRTIFQTMQARIERLESSNPEIFDIGMSFSSKFQSLEIMYRESLKKTKNLEIAQKKESAEVKILMAETTKARGEAIAFFEAFLNAFYSLLQIIAKIIPYFYEGEVQETLKNQSKYFGTLRSYLKDNPEIDSDLSTYFKDKTGWYETLVNNRHMITHKGTAFLGFEKNGRIVFIDYPRNGFHWLLPQKETKLLEKYLTESFCDLFNFLEFLANHYNRDSKMLT